MRKAWRPQRNSRTPSTARGLYPSARPPISASSSEGSSCARSPVAIGACETGKETCGEQRGPYVLTEGVGGKYHKGRTLFQFAIFCALGTFPEAAVAVAIVVFTSVGVVSDPLHALRQAVRILCEVTHEGQLCASRISITYTHLVILSPTTHTEESRW